MAYTLQIRVPAIVDVHTAVRVYWEYPELGNAQITELFGSRSPNTISRLKKAAWELMREEGAFVTNAARVPTDTAYRAWGLNIEDLEKREKRLRRYGMAERKQNHEQTADAG